MKLGSRIATSAALSVATIMFAIGGVANASSMTTDGGTRFAGELPSQTAVEVAKANFDRPEVVYLAPEKNIVSAYAVAALSDGPVFAVPKKRMPEAVGKYIGDNNPTRVVLLGSKREVSDSILKDVPGTFEIERISEPNPTALSLELARLAYPEADRVYVVNGFLPTTIAAPDAVAPGAAADGPVLLIDPEGEVPEAVNAYLQEAQPKHLVQVGAQTVAGLDFDVVLAGRDRYTTSTEVQSEAVGGKVYLVNGQSAIGLNAALNVQDGSILLIGQELPSEVCAHIYLRRPDEIVGIGDTSEISEDTLEEARGCITSGWKTSNYKIREIEEDFYASDRMSYKTHEDQAVCDKMMDLDGVKMCAPDGVRIISVNGEEEFNYTSISQLALYNIAEYKETGTERFLERAITQADAIIDLAEVRDEQMWLPYDYEFALNGEAAYTIMPPWYSAMAQGQALSVFSRLSELQPDEQKWIDARDRLFATFLQVDRYPEPFTLSFDDAGHLWFEEFAGSTPPLRVPNGHMFAVFGLYDYWEQTSDPRAEELIDAGITTIRDSFDIYRNPDAMSSYCTKMPRCRPITSMKYHAIHAMQLHYLSLMTGDEELERQSEILFEDYHEIDEKEGWGLVW